MNSYVHAWEIFLPGLGMTLGLLIATHVYSGGLLFWVPLVAAVFGTAVIVVWVEGSGYLTVCVSAICPMLLRFSGFVGSREFLGDAVVAGSAAAIANSGYGYSDTVMLVGGSVGLAVFLFHRVIRGRGLVVANGGVGKERLLKVGRVLVAGTFSSAAVVALLVFVAVIPGNLDLAYVVLYGMLVGYPLCVVVGLVGGLGTPSGDLPIVIPRSGLRRDRRVLIAAVLAMAVVAVFFGYYFIDGLMFIIVMVISVASRWPQFALARFVLAVTGRLPWRLVHFLEDAHRRGVLRQVGAVYQFRHERLQSHLAQDNQVYTDMAVPGPMALHIGSARTDGYERHTSARPVSGQ